MTTEPTRDGRGAAQGLQSWKVLPLLALGVLILAWLSRDLRTGELASALGRARSVWILIALAALAVSAVLAVFRWLAVLRCLGHRVPFGKALRVLLATWPLSVVAPSRANDLLRAHAL